jgi:hypothetical protein
MGRNRVASVWGCSRRTGFPQWSARRDAATLLMHLYEAVRVAVVSWELRERFTEIFLLFQNLRDVLHVTAQR